MLRVDSIEVRMCGWNWSLKMSRKVEGWFQQGLFIRKPVALVVMVTRYKIADLPLVSWYSSVQFVWQGSHQVVIYGCGILN